MLCSKCGGTNDRLNQRYCTDCHNKYMQGWRQTAEYSPESQFKMNTRAIAGVYKRRGKIERENCLVCSDPNAEMHHPHYNKALDVIWLCRECHLFHHQAERLLAKPLKLNVD